MGWPARKAGANSFCSPSASTCSKGMKHVMNLIVCVLAVGSIGCTQEQQEEKQARIEKKSGLMSLYQEHQQDNAAGNLNAGIDALHVTRAKRDGLDRERRKHGRGHQGSKEDGRYEQKQLSAEEIRKNREAAAKLREQQLNEARKNIVSKDDILRLQAVSLLDTDDADDLKSLENLLQADTNAEIREEAALQIAFGDRKTAEPALIQALKDPAPEVVITAIESLVSMEGKNKSAILEAISQLRDHANEDVREAAQTAMEDME